MDETQLLLSRLEDIIWDGDDSNPKFLGFLNEREASVVSSYLRNRYIDFYLYGGYDNASRVFVAVSDTEPEEYPIAVLIIKSRGSTAITHRDYLGSLMGLGIKRECVGDIISISDTEAVVFVRYELSEFITRELTKVGRDSVCVSAYTGDTYDFTARYEELRLIVASMRVDNIISACAKCSRADGAQLISDDKVFLNYLQVSKPSIHVNEGDVLSIRGYGKFIISERIGTTKKDRVVINVLHYK